MPVEGADRSWRVRYFSPESEVSFCGHATIALGTALGQHSGSGTHKLDLNNASITVHATTSSEGMAATLASPPAKSRTMTKAESDDARAPFTAHRKEGLPCRTKQTFFANAPSTSFGVLKHRRRRSVDMVRPPWLATPAGAAICWDQAIGLGGVSGVGFPRPPLVQLTARSPKALNFADAASSLDSHSGLGT